MAGPVLSAAELLDSGLGDHRAGRLEAARAAYRQVLELEPRHAEALHLLGVALHQSGRSELAVAPIDAAIAVDGGRANYFNSLGVVLTELRRYPEAREALDRAVRLGPELPGPHYNLGNLFDRQGRFAEAEASYRQSLRLAPDHGEALNNLGHVLNQLGRSAEAEGVLRAGLVARPAAAGTFNNLGIALFAQGRVEEAEGCYRQALRIEPDLADAGNNLAIALLTAGRFEEGWVAHEWRWKARHMAGGARGFAQPMWRGEPLAGRVLLLHAEQGLGDTLQFCRYAPLIEGAGAVVLEVQAPLARLLSSLPGVSRIVARGEALPPFDLHAPLMSLPLAFGTRLGTIPAKVPYLAADRRQAALWRERLAPLAGLKVGLVWAGEPRAGFAELAAIDARRSIRLAALAPLAQVAGVSFVSLQKGAGASQSADPPRPMVLHDFTVELGDFADTAALIEALDLIIAVDTSVAHLAGAMAKPTWLLNRFDTCWRWLLNRNDSPWYPTLRLFRQQTSGDWQGPIAAAAQALKDDRSTLMRC